MHDRLRRGPHSAALLSLACAVAAPALAQDPQRPVPSEPAPAVPGPAPIRPAPQQPWQDPEQDPRANPVDAEAEAKHLPVRVLSLDEALRLGRVNNVELRAAELLPQLAEQDLIVARAIFQPELYGDLGYAENQTPQRNAFQPSVSRTIADARVGWRQRVITGGLFDLAYQPARFITSSASGAFPDKQYTNEWSVTYTQPLLRSAWSDYTLANIQAARHFQNRTEQEFERTIQDTLLAIVQAYWELAFARENYLVVLAALDVAREQLRITQERIRVRELAPRDRVADEAEVALRLEELILAENEIRQREDALRRLLFDDQRGELWRWNLRPGDAIAVTPLVDHLQFEQLAEVALQNRPDLKARRAEIAEAELALLQAERDVLPALDLVGSYSSDGARESFGSSWIDAVDQEFPDWSLRLQFSIPIGNQAARAREMRARLELERRQRVLYGAMMTVTREVRDVLRSLQTLAQSIRASAESVRLAETNLETEQVRLRVGSSTVFEVQRRNQELRAARSRHLRNQLDFRIAESRMRHAQGLLQVPGD